MTVDLHAQLFKTLYADRVLAHEVIFRHRHPNSTQPFHKELIRAWHSDADKRSLVLAFRGSAKSTIAEEAICLRAGFREFKNALIIGETYDRAAERLHAIKHELESNEALEEVFGALRGPIWGDGELILSNGARIMALGRGQALRGIKFEDKRPDAIFLDDIETAQSVSTKEGRKKTSRWLFTEVLPACDPHAFVRMAATPLAHNALAPSLVRDATWKVHIYPAEFVNAEGERESSWPDRFPLAELNNRRKEFESQGLFGEYEREYLCSIATDETRTFQENEFKVEPHFRTWQPVYAMFDPARTTNANSATTGYACWSWIGNRLIVWDAWGRMLMPDEIVTAMFDCALSSELPPVWVGVEEDGLNEFLLQPIRQEQIRRGESIPFRAVRAPRGKLDFIKGLQPYFKAGEVQFAKPLPDLKEQLLGFPNGRIDVPNALAYALRLRPGMPVYANFSSRNVFEDLDRVSAAPAWLVVNATRSLLCAALVQFWEGTLFVLNDWVREGSPAETLREITVQAQLLVGKKLMLCAPPVHFEYYNTTGLVQSAARIPLRTQRGAAAGKGAPTFSALLQREQRGFPCLRVSSNARWTLNALSGGYTRGLKNGILTEAAEDGPYKVLMEGVESFAGLTEAGALFDETSEMNYAYTPSGQRYISVRR